MNRWTQATFAVVAALLTALTIYQQASDCQTSGAGQGLEVLDPQPVDFAVPNLTLRSIDGGAVKLAETREQPVLINFWATWCVPCIQEMPQLLLLAQNLRDRAQVWLISVDENFDDIKNLAHELTQAEVDQPHQGLAPAAQMLLGKEPNVRILLDTGENAARHCGTYKYPESFLLNAQGRVYRKFIGPKAWGQPHVLEYLRTEGFLSGS